MRRTFDFSDKRPSLTDFISKYSWEFIFLGANIDAAKEAARFGIRADRAVSYLSDHEGTALNYEVISETVSCIRACPSAPLAASWKDRIKEDFKKRGKKN